MKPITMDGRYRYRNGEPARVLCVDAPSDMSQSVISMDLFGLLFRHFADGTRTKGSGPTLYDLIEAIPPWEGELWVRDKDVIFGRTPHGETEGYAIYKGWRKINAKEVEP